MWSGICLRILFWYSPGGIDGICAVTLKCIGKLSNQPCLNRLRNTVFLYFFDYSFPSLRRYITLKFII